jgi:beta-lactamase class A
VTLLQAVSVQTGMAFFVAPSQGIIGIIPYLPRLLFLIAALIAIASIRCRNNNDMKDLQQNIETELQKATGTFAVAFYDLHADKQLLINAHEKFHAASTMKTPVMIEVYKQAGLGKFALSDSVLVKNEFSSIVDGSPFQLNPEDDSDQTLYGAVGKKRSIASLVYDMIIVSSNLATNIVIERVDAKNVMATLREAGVNDMQVLRGVEDSKAFQQGLNNSTTAYDLMLIFKKLAQGEFVSKTACEEMIRILMDQRFNEMIPAGLPEGTKVAHKTGNITGVRHDSGIVFLPDGRKYVLVLLSKGLEDENAGMQTMASVSRMIYEYMVPGRD